MKPNQSVIDNLKSAYEQDKVIDNLTTIVQTLQIDNTVSHNILNTTIQQIINRIDKQEVTLLYLNESVKNESGLNMTVINTIIDGKVSQLDAITTELANNITELPSFIDD